jgi:sulfur-oxidizing protein SoxB
LSPDWTFGIQEEEMQKVVDEARAKGAQVGGAALAQRHGRRHQDGLARARGIDAILGGHTHDGVPAPVVVKNPAARRW